jgi:hypothetical protein
MQKLRAALDEIAHKIGLTKLLLAKARRRRKKFRARAERLTTELHRTLRRADEARKKKEPERAEWLDRKAIRVRARAERSAAKSQWWIGRIKLHQRRIHGLQNAADELEAEIAKLEQKRKPRIEGNKAVGSTPGNRWKLYCLQTVRNCSNGTRRNYYSQGGSWDVQHEIKPGPNPASERSDCSQYLTGVAWGCDLPDPNGEDFHAGFTGTLISESNGWRKVSREAMEKKGWGYVVYGGGVGHHTEAFVGNGRTIGHGSAPVDFGVVDLFGDGDYRCYVHDAK